MAPLGSVRSVDLDDVDAVSVKKARLPGTIRTGSFDTDFSHRTEALEPREQDL